MTEWLAYFHHSMAETFRRVADEVRAQAKSPTPPDPPELQRLDRRARIVLGMFTQRETLTTTEIARALGLSPRTVRDLVTGWLADGWLGIEDLARRSRRYRLSAEYRRFIGGTTAEV